jgi:addiction module RelE/StbE family toxin
MFCDGVRREPLNDHPLTGKLKGLRAFSVGGDVRVVYQEAENYYLFLDIGSHNQVY